LNPKIFLIFPLICSLSLFAAKPDEKMDQNTQFSSSSDLVNNIKDGISNGYTDNFIISITPAAVQPSFTIPFSPHFPVNLVQEGDDIIGTGLFAKKRLPAEYSFGITGQFSYLLPTESYLDLFYNYYHIHSTGSDRISPDEFILPDSSQIGYNFKASLKGQYHFGEFYFRTRIALLNLLDKYFHNQLSLGFSFQNINLHYINNLHITIDEDLGGLAQKQKHKVFGFGPAFKWESQIDLLPMRLRPHNLSFVSEVKFALLFAKYHAKSKLDAHVRDFEFDGSDIDSIDIDASWRRLTDYFTVLNTNLKAGLRYSYKGFSFEFAYKILYFSDEDYETTDFLKGTLSEGILPDVTDFFNIFPGDIGFRALECNLTYSF